jgi:acetyltransferase-like isoleucine patch superfamily enzyme
MTAGPDDVAEMTMRNFLRSYLRAFDIAVYLGQTARGIVRTKCTPARFGPLPNVRGRVRFHIRGTAVFGEHFTAQAESGTLRITVAPGARLTVGDHVAMNYGVNVDVWHEVRIGNKVMIAPNVTIIDDSRHELEPGTPLYKGPTVIGDNVWLAANVTVLPGVTIGAGSVIAGNSVVSRDIPPNSLAGGSPARVLKTLNVPDRWSHRFGYEKNEPAAGLLASVRRIFSGDPTAARAGEGADAEADVVRPDPEVVR